MIFSRYRFYLCWLVPLLILDVFLFMYWWRNYYLPASKEITKDHLPPASRLKFHFDYPTDRELDRFNLKNFQPTASGRPESALFGSVRTAWAGRKLVPSFHEGIDVAPMERDQRGCPLDDVCTVADAEVAYINPIAGNSNYGKYVVLSHGEGTGRLYTLYAHLDKIAPGLRKNTKVKQGDVLGIMGATSTDRILPANAHLHFEVAMMLNSRFDQWYKRKRRIPDHGSCHGWNLIGIDPLAVYEQQEASGGDFDLLAHLDGIGQAFEIIVRMPEQLDFFRRYPALWRDKEYMGGAMVLACSENGLPLGGRSANPGETNEMGRRKYKIRNVDESVLGRNGCRLVVRQNGKWRLGSEGEKWLSILMY